MLFTTVGAALQLDRPYLHTHKKSQPRPTYNTRLPIRPEVPEKVLGLETPPSVGPRGKQGLDEPHQGRADHAQRAESGANRGQSGREKHDARREQLLAV